MENKGTAALRPSSSVQLSLKENSHAFLQEAIRKAVAATSDLHQWQFAILHLVQAAEVTLKSALHERHPALVLENLDANRSENTVTIRQALQRLRHPAMGGLAFADRDVKRLEGAIKVRNQITHSDFELSEAFAAAKFFELLPFVLAFQKHQLGVDLREILDPVPFDALLGIEKALQELVRAAEDRIQAEGLSSDDVWCCPLCGEDAFVISDGIDTCYVCHHKETLVACPQCEKFYFEDELKSFADLLDTGIEEGRGIIYNDYGFKQHNACPECLPGVREQIEREREADLWHRELDYWAREDGDG